MNLTVENRSSDTVVLISFHKQWPIFRAQFVLNQDPSSRDVFMLQVDVDILRAAFEGLQLGIFHTKFAFNETRTWNL